MRTQDTIRILNRLIRVCRDGEDFCYGCSDAVGDAGLQTLLHYRSEEWGRQGDELQALVLLLGGEPATSGTLGERALRAWLVMRAAVIGPSDIAVLGEWQRIQQLALERYEEAIGGYLPERIRRTIGLQADRIMDRLEHISVLRDQRAIHPHGVQSM